MNRETGRIYDLEDMYPTREDRRRLERSVLREEHTMLDELAGARERQGYSDPAEVLDLEAERREFERATARGDAVPVSGQVARTMRTGQREHERRRRRRKAQRQARKANR